MISRRLLSALSIATGILAIAVANSFAQPSGLAMISPAALASDADQPRDDAAPVQATLNQFDSALASHDVTLLQAVGIKPAHARGWQRFFRDNPAASVTDSCPRSELYISGNTASWYCTETATVISERKPVSYSKVIHFTFTRTNGGWTISDRR